jgi:ElaA protein
MILRQRVFVLEQNCAYLDADGVDRRAWHLFAREPHTGALAAYLRVPHAGIKYPELSIGRVVSSPEARKSGAGRALMAEALKRITAEFGGTTPAIRISAQSYLERFYQSFGFETVSEPYLEDNIPHVEMFRAAGKSL